VDARVTRIRPGDWALLRDLRLRGLQDSPDAFGQRHDEAVRQSDAEWRSNAQASAAGTRRTWFIARSPFADEPIGLVQGRRRPPDDCLLFSMWVAPAARRSGVGGALVDAIERWSADWGARRVVLWVLAANEPAMRFYERIGFRLLEEGVDAESGRRYGAFAMERAVNRGSVDPG